MYKITVEKEKVPNTSEYPKWEPVYEQIVEEVKVEDVIKAVNSMA